MKKMEEDWLTSDHNCHWLAGVDHFPRRQELLRLWRGGRVEVVHTGNVGRRDDAEHAGQGHGRRAVDLHDVCAALFGQRESGVQHSARIGVGDVPSLTGALNQRLQFGNGLGDGEVFGVWWVGLLTGRDGPGKGSDRWAEPRVGGIAHDLQGKLRKATKKMKWRVLIAIVNWQIVEARGGGLYNGLSWKPILNRKNSTKKRTKNAETSSNFSL